MTILNGQPIPDPTPRPTVTPAAAPIDPMAKAEADGSAVLIGFIALIFSLTLPVVGIVLGAIGMQQAKKAGTTNILAKIAFILGIVLTALIIIGVVIFVIFFANLFTDIFGTCQQLGPGTHYVNGTEYTCS